MLAAIEFLAGARDVNVQFQKEVGIYTLKLMCGDEFFCNLVVLGVVHGHFIVDRDKRTVFVLGHLGNFAVYGREDYLVAVRVLDLDHRVNAVAILKIDGGGTAGSSVLFKNACTVSIRAAT